MDMKHSHTIILSDEYGNTIDQIDEEHYLNIPGVLTEAEGIELTRLENIEKYNATLKAEMISADIANLRALYENDKPRIAKHMAEQAERRNKLKEVK